MIHEQNTARVQELASNLGLECDERDKLTLTFARTSESVLCRIERQGPEGHYQSMQISLDLQTGDQQLEQITSDRAASEISRDIAAAIDRAYGLLPQPSSQKGIFLLPKNGPATILRYHWDDRISSHRLIDTEELDNDAAMFFSEIANKMIAVTHSFEA